MRERLKEYVERLFANAPATQSVRELKEEMLQNLYDKYDDLLAEGKSEEDAYEAAIAGIGDVSGLIGSASAPAASSASTKAPLPQPAPKQKNPVVLAVAIVLYVLCVAPNILFGGVTGVVMMFVMIAVATAMMIMNRTAVHPVRAAFVGVGVALCILCPTPAMSIGGVLGATLLFVLLAAGVGLIVYGRTSRFDDAPAEDSNDTSGMARATRHAYIALIAVCVLLMLGAIFIGDSARRHAQWYGVTDEMIVDEGAFEERLEDAIEKRIYDDYDDVDDDDDDDKAAKGKKKSGKQDAVASVAIMEGAVEVPADGIAEIEIDWVGGSVNVAPYGGDTIAISETAARTLTDKQKLRYTVKGNKLSISYCEETFLTWDWLDIDRLSMPNKALTVQLPAGTLSELEINGVSAIIGVDGVACDELEVVSVSGAVTVSDVSGSKLSVQTKSGTIDITGADVAKLDFESVSGSIVAKQTRANEVDVETISGNAALELTASPVKLESESASGDVTLTLPAGATDFTALVQSVSGDFECNIAGVSQNGRYVVGSGASRYEFSSVSGDVRITAG